MSIKAVLFDLDGTLLPMDYEAFVGGYFKLLAGKLAPLGYEPEGLVKSIWKGTGAMIRNDGSKVNEEAFWTVFESIYGEDCLKHKDKFDEFYRVEFLNAKSFCSYDENAAKVIKLVKEKGLKAVLATNPIFPAVATEARISWAGLDKDEFEIYTTFENSSYCKPNLKYYLEICEKLGLEPSECAMIGNDVSEDMVAKELGMKVFLLTDCILNKENKDISEYPQGGFLELLDFIEKLA